jgi:hypothetical protein
MNYEVGDFKQEEIKADQYMPTDPISINDEF